jgi:hypothetical protein
MTLSVMWGTEKAVTCLTSFPSSASLRKTKNDGIPDRTRIALVKEDLATSPRAFTGLFGKPSDAL